MERYAPEDGLLLTYEGLTDDHIGDEVAAELNDFLGKAEDVTPTAKVNVPCIWGAAVKNIPPGSKAFSYCPPILQNESLHQYELFFFYKVDTHREVATKIPNTPRGRCDHRWCR
jgi:hypothetical protein